VEWFGEYKRGTDSHCSKDSEALFTVAEDLGYSIFKPSLPLRRVEGCQNR
jgi:hypothetical protein